MSALLIITLGLWCAGWLLHSRIKPFRAGSTRFTHVASDFNSGPSPVAPTTNHQSSQMPAQRFSARADNLTPDVLARQLSIIIPARNEEHNLPKLLRSISSQPVKPHQIIVVDDGSTDRTADVARQLGAKVVASQPLPDGWRGKTWACYQGAKTARGQLLMFLDADTWFEPDSLGRVLEAYASQLSCCCASKHEQSAPLVAQSSGSPEQKHRPEPALQTVQFSQSRRSRCSCLSDQDSLNLALQSESEPRARGAFSVGPFHAVQKLYEDLSLFFNLCMVAGTAPNGLFGQMLLVDRASYWQVGGHESVKSQILENYFLTDGFRTAGIPVRSVTGRGMLTFRTYPNGLGELIEGWTKGFAAGAGQTPPNLLTLIVCWMIGLMLALIGWLLTFKHATWGVLYLAYAAQVMWFARQLGSFSPLTALLYPVPLLFFFIVFARAMLRAGKPVSWKGRIIRAG